MATDFTFAMIKPGPVQEGHTGAILELIEKAGFRILAMKLTRLTNARAGQFYAVHKDRPFYNSVCEFMSSGKIVAMILEKENAVEDFRTLIGATDPAKAEPISLRALFGKDIQQNAIHGSDSPENAKIEAAFFFSNLERHE